VIIVRASLGYFPIGVFLMIVWSLSASNTLLLACCFPLSFGSSSSSSLNMSWLCVSRVGRSSIVRFSTSSGSGCILKWCTSGAGKEM
jgi:hypothetical protein